MNGRRKCDPKMPRTQLDNLSDAFEINEFNECWIWHRRLDSRGYGVFSLKGKVIAAHRFFFVLYKGPIPEGNSVHHTCQNPACVNPAHLEAMTSSEHRKVHAKLNRKTSKLQFCDSFFGPRNLNNRIARHRFAGEIDFI